MYLMLPAGDEPEIVRSAVEPGASILELGSGAGRVTRELVDMGYRVTAVDESAAMLAHVGGAETVLARIEDLDLGRTFDAVLLTSHLVNTDDRGQCASVLAACRRHVDDDGRVLIQRHDPDPSAWTPGRSRTATLGRVLVTGTILRREGTTVEGVVRYALDDGRAWTQHHRSEILDDEPFEAVLREAGLTLVRWLDPARTWALAEPRAQR